MKNLNSVLAAASLTAASLLSGSAHAQESKP